LTDDICGICILGFTIHLEIFIFKMLTLMFCDFDRAVSARLCSGICLTPVDWTIFGALQALVTVRCKRISECNISIRFQLNSSNRHILAQEAGRSTATLTSLMTAVHDGRRFPPEDAPISSTR
jgi:hypothetical protein